MKTRSFHETNLGAYGAGLPTDHQGYVTVHDSARYDKASNVQLEEWALSRVRAIRAAALTEQAQRALREWQRGNVS